MNYNIHPLFVHFPIALLVLYSLIKIIPLRRVLPNVTWKPIERILLVVGVAGAFVSLSTGEMAEHLSRPNHTLVETHALFASAATWLYGALLAGELLVILTPWITTKPQLAPLRSVLIFFKELLTHPILATTLAVLGLVAISVAGLLGGVMVYGTSADPAAALVLKALHISL